jgi:uncharacterized cysteine cluster protein YcgN (CxxCxxCC family)
MSRSCDGCTKCCEGWLHGEAHKHFFWPGRPCHFKSQKGCSIYQNRPDNPCKSFKCEWLMNEVVPVWMKPDQINAIIVVRQENDKIFWEVSEAGSKLDSKVLSWLFMLFHEGKIPNLRYQIEGGWNSIWR